MHAFITTTKPIFPLSPDIKYFSSETSIGIDIIREIQTFLSKKPFQSKQNIVIIENAETITIPAQNALLKTLEDPPGNANIYLITYQPDLLLPTVLSRCELIKNPSLSSDQKDFSRFEEYVNLNTTAARIIFLESLSLNRNSYPLLMEFFEFYIHKNLQALDDTSKLLLSLHRVKKYLDANSNIRLITIYISKNIYF